MSENESKLAGYWDLFNHVRDGHHIEASRIGRRGFGDLRIMHAAMHGRFTRRQRARYAEVEPVGG